MGVLEYLLAGSGGGLGGETCIRGRCFVSLERSRIEGR